MLTAPSVKKPGKICGAFTANEDELDEIYDRLIKTVWHRAGRWEYDDYVPLGCDRMNRNSLREEQIEEFRKQVKTDWCRLPRRSMKPDACA